MAFEPQKFFIGLIDFFSVILPGALLTYLFKDTLGPWLLGQSYFTLGETEGWIALLFGAYLLGHLVFLIGSLILDDLIYDRIRQATPLGQTILQAQGNRVSGRLAQALARLFFKKGDDQALQQVIGIKKQHLDPIHASDAINAFQWSKARLTLEKPEALAVVQRFEADSKFFRSLVIVLCFASAFSLGKGRYDLFSAATLLVFAAFWRYVDQRAKATKQAYWYIITLEGQREAKPRVAAQRENGPTHAGGVVFRRGERYPEYLLVQARRAPEQWVLPKGHIEEGESPADAAVREVREETGVCARVVAKLDEISFPVDREVVTVAFHLMECVEEGSASEGRHHFWLPLDRAICQATHTESRALLRLADQALAGTPREDSQAQITGSDR